MKYLGSERVVTSDFSSHKTAEDYAGNHLSDISITGSGKVTKIINSFKSHEDSINYNSYLNNRNVWKDGNYYNCISIPHLPQAHCELPAHNRKSVLFLCA